MPSLGPAEILVILVIALLVFGPEKLPDIAKQVGKGMREFRRVQQHLSTELRDVVTEFDGSAETAAPSPDGGDPVPMLPPKVETDPGEAAPTTAGPGDTGGAVAPPAAAVPPATAAPPAAPDAPAVPTADDRGRRVWPPPASPPDA